MELKRTYKLFETTALREYRVSNSYALKSDKNWFGLQSVYHGVQNQMQPKSCLTWFVNQYKGKQKLDTILENEALA